MIERENNPVEWPAIYIEHELDEELMLIEETDWYHDVDTHYTIGPIESGGHFLIDSSSRVYSLHGYGVSPSGTPAIEIGAQLSEDKWVLALLWERAVRWHKFENENLTELIALLVQCNK